MQFSTSLILAAIPFLALGQPAKLHARHSNDYVFTLISIHSGNEAVHNQAVTARAGGLFIGGGGSSPTVFDVDDGTTNLLLDSQASIRPLVSLNTDGTLAWTASSDDAPSDGSISTGFALTDAVQGEVVRNLLLDGDESWLACPVAHAPGTYRVLSAYRDFTIDSSLGPRDTCIDIALAAISFTGDLPAAYS